MNLVIFSCVPWASDGGLNNSAPWGVRRLGKEEKRGKSCKFDGKFVSLQR